MQIKTLLLAPLLASGLVSAAPSTTAKSTPFQVVGIPAPNSHLKASKLQAARNQFYLGLPDQKATCDLKPGNAATFQIVDGELWLYNKKGNTERAFSDLSGMGQGVFQYSNAKTLPKNFITKGWSIGGGGVLSFGGRALLACPGAISNSWSVWVNTGSTHPGGNKNCLVLTSETAPMPKPPSCTYTHRIQ